MKDWKNYIDEILNNNNKINWEDIGNKYLNDKYNNNLNLFENYQLFNGLDNMYPVNFYNCLSEYIDKPYNNYQNIIKDYQPLLILVNNVYHKLENFSEEEILMNDIPLTYFLRKSILNCIDNSNYEINNENNIINELIKNNDSIYTMIFNENSLVSIKSPDNYILQIDEANYDDKDVSLIVRSFVIKESDKLLLINDNYNKLFGDPVPGKYKKLSIKYSFIKNDSNIIELELNENSKIKKFVIVTDWLLTSIYLEPYIFSKNLEKFGWKLIIQSKLDIHKLKKQKCIVLCMTFDSFDITQIKCDNVTLCYMFNDVYPYREIRNICINTCDYLFGTFTYLFPLWTHKYPRLLEKPSCWIPYSAVNEFYNDIQINETPIKKIFVTGYINDTYPLRKYMVELSKSNDNIVVLPHPNYEDKERKHQYINKEYYEKLNEYLCCFNDALTWNYVNIKVFEISAVGSLLLIQDSIEEQLNELGYYNNINCIMCNKDNLIEKIEWILDDNNLEEINIIRRKGMEITREKNNTEQRSIKFNNYINQEIINKIQKIEVIKEEK